MKKKMGCFVDCEYGYDEPDLTCDLENDSESIEFGDCEIAKKLKIQGKTKEDCEHWKEIIPTKCIHGKYLLDKDCIECVEDELKISNDFLNQLLNESGGLIETLALRAKIRLYLGGKKMTAGIFDPVVLQITLETENEVRDFWSRFLLNGDMVVKAIKENINDNLSISYDGSYDGSIVWNMIDDICCSRNISD